MMVYVVVLTGPFHTTGYLWHGKKMLCLENAQTFARSKNAQNAADRYTALYTRMQAEVLTIADATKQRDAAAAGEGTDALNTTEGQTK